MSDHDHDHEKALDSPTQEDGKLIAASAIGANASNATLEDCLFFADQQYAANDDRPLPNLEGAHDEHDIHLDGGAPGPAIRRGPLQYLWGPASPPTSLLVKRRTHADGSGPIDEKKGVVGIGAQKGAEHDVVGAHITPEAVAHEAAEHANTQAGKDTMDRLILRRVTMFRTFFLITCDVLGPYQGPYVYAQVGYVPATIVYVVMGVMAYLASLNLNVLYLRLDSDQAPIRNYAYLVQRLWGTYGKVIIDFFFIVQLIFQCGELLLTNAQSLALIIDGSNSTMSHHVCFSVLVVVMLAINLLLSPIKSLKSISWLSALSLFLAVCSLAILTAFIFTSPPNFEQAKAAYGIDPGPVIASAFVSQPLAFKVNGIMNMVYAYGGAMIFIDIFAEMRRPWDFWKSLAIAQSLIMTIYILFGILIYARQGQFTQSLFYFGVSKYSYQTVGNAIGLYTGIVSAILYGNIAQKEFYYIVVRQLFKGPRLMSRQSWPFWLVGNFIIWALAYVVGAGIPQVQTVSGVIGAVTVLQFSYSFPFLLKFTFDVQLDAMKGDRPYNGDGQVGRTDHRVDSWTSWSRWKRGLFTGNVVSKAAYLILGLASISMAGLGVYGSAEAIKLTFASAAATSFGCATP